ncbi:MAG: hypothetical protein WC823_06080 [Parcubacteria group bacterium]|jgi:hypothetical protein
MNLEKYTRYGAENALWVITVYYNPCGYKHRRSTYDAFMHTMRSSGINVLTVECAFGNDHFELPASLDVIKIRSDSLLWQKERLINIGTCYLPETCKYVAWIDCDVVFDNMDWARETCRLLSDSCTIVQLFDSCLRLEKNNHIPNIPDRAVSFAAVTTRDMSTLNCGRYDMHGHTGYGWAMRREIFDAVGLYEYAVSGSADHFMAHAIYGQYGFCIENALKHDQKQIKHLKTWGDEFHAHTKGKLGVVSGEIHHLWHGSHDRRDYFRRMWKITEYGYNPDTDLIAMPGKPLEWQPQVWHEKPDLVAYFAGYFASRQEDTE